MASNLIAMAETASNLLTCSFSPYDPIFDDLRSEPLRGRTTEPLDERLRVEGRWRFLHDAAVQVDLAAEP